MGLEALIHKYSTPGPRYTSYPTAPQWSESVGPAAYADALTRVKEGEPLSLYVHLPFCEKLCYYCGCNIQITHDKKRSRSYVDQILRELELVATRIPGNRPVAQISWGGGTPTFLSCEEIEAIGRAIRGLFAVEAGAEINIEIDPRVTTTEQLSVLREQGFNRASLGVQDFNPDVQQAINRIQPAQMTADLLAQCRQRGFEGVNFDLIYGLPNQTLSSFEDTIGEVVKLRPDRIALYNYARLPSLLKHQSILEKYPMPSAEERVSIFSMAFERLRAVGYEAIGMDHFALVDDSLSKALREGRLYRNFMGYCVKQGVHLLGVGASAIGEVGGGFFQNIKKASDYEASIAQGKLATLRGLVLSEDDLRRKWVIQRLMCQFGVSSDEFARTFGVEFREVFGSELEALDPLREDGFLEGDGTFLKVTELGRLFVRNIAMGFDAYLQSQRATFSKTV